MENIDAINLDDNTLSIEEGTISVPFPLPKEPGYTTESTNIFSGLNRYDVMIILFIVVIVALSIAFSGGKKKKK